MQLKGRDQGSPLTYHEFDLLVDEVLTDQPKKIAVAVSGGGDSMALALLMHEWCSQNNVEMTALTVDHGLRPESAAEAQMVKSWFDEKSINHQLLTWVGHKPDANIQDEARNARYRLMGQWCANNNIKHLFLAHHKNDQAETFLIRLFRGSGVDGLSAIESKAPFPYQGIWNEGLFMYRPLLSVPKGRLLAFLKNKKQSWVDDPSNEKQKYLRIQVRDLIGNSDIKGLDINRLSLTAQRMQRVRSLLDQLTDDVESVAVSYSSLGFAILKLEKLLGFHEEIALRLLSRILKKVSGGHYPPRLHKLERLYGKIQTSEFSGQTLMGTIVSVIKEDEIIFVREANAITDMLSVKNEKKVLWDKRFIIDVEGMEGVVKPLSGKPLESFMENNADFKEEINKCFDGAIMRDRIMSSLPCIETKHGVVLLPDVMLQFLGIRNLSGFSMVFKE